MTQEVRLKRSQCNYRAETSRFLLECDFSHQYSNYYRKRLERSKLFLEYNCRQRWRSNFPIHSIGQLEESRDLCIIIGTIFKRMKLQPDVVEELSRGDFHVKCERYFGHYVSPDDRLVLEDNDESIALTGNIKPDQFVTGVVVALLGRPIGDAAQFKVEDICYAEPNNELLYDDMMDSQNMEVSRPLATTGPLYLLVLSGLGFSHDIAKRESLTSALQGLIDFVWGGGKFENDNRSSMVSRILVVGDNLTSDRSDTRMGTPGDSQIASAGPSDKSRVKNSIAEKMLQSRQVKPYLESIQAVKHLDDFFAELSKTIAVNVMPGPVDPSSHLMPQQPFHPCMFPKSCIFSTFNCTTNPYHAIYDDNVEILATSSQNVDIVSKFSGLSDPIDVMKKHLLWGSCAPSAPDNLYSVPYEDEDPFVIDFIPDVYIAGNQEYYRAETHFYTNSDESSILFSEDESKDASCNNSSSSKVIKSESTRGCSDVMPKDSSWTPKKKDRTLLITVPKFCDTFTCVLINLKNLKTELVSFD